MSAGRGSRPARQFAIALGSGSAGNRGNQLGRPVKRLWHKRRDDMPHCSNPIALDRRADEIDTGAWTRAFAEGQLISACSRSIFRAEELAARRDIVEITAAAHRASLYTNLITSELVSTEKKLAVLAWKPASTTSRSRSRMPTPPRRTGWLTARAAMPANAALASEVVRGDGPS